MRAWAEINLARINLNIQALKKRGDLILVIKDNAYGHGDIPVAREAVKAGINWFAVSTIDEGVELRLAGFRDQRILLLSEPEYLHKLKQFNITPVAYTEKFIERLAEFVPESPVHLNVDTGFRRLGCEAYEAPYLANKLQESGLVFEGLMTHLAGANDELQLLTFDAVIRSLSQRPQIIHAASSKATKASYGSYDMNRCGLAVYEGAMVLKANLSLVKPVLRGEGVSYNWAFKAKQRGYVGVVGAGYGDGIPKRMVGRKIKVGDDLFPVAAVTMDHTIVDLGQSQPPLGSFVDFRLNKWEEWFDMIPYEVMTGIRSRVKRIYIGI